MRALRLSPFLVTTCFVVPCFAQNGPCVEDGDCAPTEECLLDQVSSAGCPPDQECEPVEVEPSGWCYPKPVTCGSDADCPEPTRCADDGECEYVLERCETDAMCDARYACTDIRGGTSCAPAGEAGTPPEAVDGAGVDDPGEGDPGAAGDPDEEDPGGDAETSDPKAAGDPLPDSEPADDDSVAPPGMAPPPEAEECEPREPELVCFPEVEPCEDDSDCEGDWTCEILHDDGPGAWSGVEKACLPPGLVGVLDGTIDVEGSGVSEDGNASGEGSGEVPDDDEVMDDDADPNDALGLGTQGGSEGSSGCAVGGSDPRRALPWALLLVGIALLRRRAGVVAKPPR